MHLTDFVVKNLKKPGRYTDDQTRNLHLWIKKVGKKYWIWRFTIDGERFGMSLGSYPEVRLKEAREKATEARNSVNQGINPIHERQAKKEKSTPRQITLFAPFALDYIEVMRPKWRNEKHADQWVSTVKTYAFPVIGALPLDQVDTPHLLQILQPIWLTKPETASRLRGRLERILSAAVTRKLRPAQNPALWKGHLETLMPPTPKSDAHHEALPYPELPKFLARLQDRDSVSALALEFTILNAARTSEVLLGERSEVTGGVWSIPASRMKARRPHQVPLCERSLDLLEMARDHDPESRYLFSRRGKPLSSMTMLSLLKRLRPELTVHGFRSTFRDWVSEETDHSPEVAEMALAHTIGNKVEAAYRRGNLLKRRRRLMQDWEDYCLEKPSRNILPLRAVQAQSAADNQEQRRATRS